MELTRRDAMAALASAGVAVGAGVAISRPSTEPAVGDRLDGAELATLVALGEVLYPSELDGVDRFVRQYVRGRTADDGEPAAGMADAIAYLDDYARAWHDRRFADLDAGRRDDALRRMDTATAEPNPDGSDVERVRYYLVNELLFALYASPTGGKLVGIENPPGYPGGLASYQLGPRS